MNNRPQRTDEQYRELDRLMAAHQTFQVACWRKLVEKFDQGFRGWDDPEYAATMEQTLQECVEEGPEQRVDVANLAMFLWHLERDAG